MPKKDREQAAVDQRARFVETARKLGTDQNLEALDRVLGKAVPPVRPKPPPTKPLVPTKDKA